MLLVEKQMRLFPLQISQLFCQQIFAQNASDNAVLLRVFLRSAHEIVQLRVRHLLLTSPIRTNTGGLSSSLLRIVLIKLLTSYFLLLDLSFNWVGQTTQVLNCLCSGGHPLLVTLLFCDRAWIGFPCFIESVEEKWWLDILGLWKIWNLMIWLSFAAAVWIFVFNLIEFGLKFLTLVSSRG